ncbi:hypothetical protein Hanom_Chr11g01056351 [Helianthus anomalus]
MELTSRMKMANISNLSDPDAEKQTLGQSRKTGQTSWTKMAFYSKLYLFAYELSDLLPFHEQRKLVQFHLVILLP